MILREYGSVKSAPAERRDGNLNTALKLCGSGVVADPVEGDPNAI